MNIAPTKAAIEEHLKKLQECLVTSLKRAAQLEKDAVEAFIAEGKTLLEANASSVRATPSPVAPRLRGLVPCGENFVRWGG